MRFRASKFKLILFIALCLSMGVNLLYAKSKDSHYSNYTVIKKKLNDKLDAFVHANLKFKDDMSRLYYFYIRNGLTFHAHKNLDLGLAYRWVETQVKKTTEKDWKIEHRLEFEIAPKTNLGELKVIDKNKFEYRYFENEGRDNWRYRNSFELSYPVEIFNVPISLLCSEEFFYELNAKEINTHWLTAGFGKKLNENLNLDIFFRVELIRKAEGINSWDRINVLGTKLTWYFK